MKKLYQSLTNSRHVALILVVFLFCLYPRVSWSAVTPPNEPPPPYEPAPPMGGDQDGDGLSDYADPCPLDADCDDDGLRDDVDPYPLDPSPTGSSPTGQPPTGSVNSYRPLGALLFQTLYKVMLPGAILIGVVLIILNGYKLMSSQGDPRKVQDGKEGLTSAILGIVFVLLAITILRIILGGLFGFQGGSVPF